MRPGRQRAYKAWIRTLLSLVGGPARRATPREGGMALKASYFSGMPLLELMKEIQETAPTVRLGMFTCLTSGCLVTRLSSTVVQRCELWFESFWASR
jgi:hypothetical protein